MSQLVPVAALATMVAMATLVAALKKKIGDFFSDEVLSDFINIF